MKKPEEYLDKYNILKDTKHHNYDYLFNKTTEAIKQAQKDAWNAALDKAAEEAEAKGSDVKPLKKGLNFMSFFEVDKQSILKLKIK